jgi:hypothetical protein
MCQHGNTRERERERERKNTTTPENTLRKSRLLEIEFSGALIASVPHHEQANSLDDSFIKAFEACVLVRAIFTINEFQHSSAASV